MNRANIFTQFKTKFRFIQIILVGICQKWWKERKTISMKIQFKGGQKIYQSGNYRERKQRRPKIVTHNVARRFKRKSCKRRDQKFICDIKSSRIHKLNRAYRISIEYEAFCRAQVCKETTKRANKRKRRVAFRAARDHFIRSIVKRAISSAELHFENRNEDISIGFITEVFAIIIEALLMEMNETENCEFCRIECAEFGLRFWELICCQYSKRIYSTDTKFWSKVLMRKIWKC